MLLLYYTGACACSYIRTYIYRGFEMRGEGEGGMASLGVYMYLSVLYWFIIFFFSFESLRGVRRVSRCMCVLNKIKNHPM